MLITPVLIVLTRRPLEPVAILDGLSPDLAPGSMLAEHLSALGRYDAFRAGFIGLGQSAWFLGTTLVFLTANTWAVQRLRD